MDVSHWIAHWSRRTPRRTALRFEDGSVSYAELEARIRSVSARIHDHGVRAGDRVAYLGPSCPFHVGGLLIFFTPALCAGAGVTIHRQFEPGRVIADVARNRVTLLASVPSDSSTSGVTST